LVVRNLIYDKYIKPFYDKYDSGEIGFVGVELEFPLINLNKKPVSTSITNQLMKHIVSQDWGFSISCIDDNGNICEVKRTLTNGEEVIGFDNSYNNLEFSMAKARTIAAISERFYNYLSNILDFLGQYDYTIIGIGSNQYKQYIEDSPVETEPYKTIHKYLTDAPYYDNGQESLTYHNYNIFPAYISSVQTHVDVEPEHLADAFNLFSRLDFVRAILFSNSPPLYDMPIELKDYICCRDYLWENSGFAYNPESVGKNDFFANDYDDIIDNYLQRSIFMRIRQDASGTTKYEHFKPVPLYKYFSDPAFDAIPEDIFSFLSFKTVELTFRGTLEIRSDCAQQLENAFAPVYFNFGLSKNLQNACQLCDDFWDLHDLYKISNSTLRNQILSGKKISAIIPSITDDVIADFIEKLNAVAGIK
jgi:gamma-glutamylcysteine synthetase